MFIWILKVDSKVFGWYVSSIVCCFLLKGAPPPKKKKIWLNFGKFSQMCEPPTHPRVFVRFGKTKGEIRVDKGDFRGDLGGF